MKGVIKWFGICLGTYILILLFLGLVIDASIAFSFILEMLPLGCLVSGLVAFAIQGKLDAKEETESKEKKQQTLIEQNQSLENRIIQAHLPAMTVNYNRQRRLLSIPDNCSKIDVETTVFGLQYKAQAPTGRLEFLRNNFYCWKSDNALYIFPTEEHITRKHITYATLLKDLDRLLNDNDIHAVIIPHREIQYYKLSGQERAETNVTSINNGTNIEGAIIGGLIAGDAGAIIGSQHNKGKIVSYTSHFDDRFVELYYTQSGNTYKLKLSVTAYPLLEKWFPDKDYDFVNSRSGIQPTADKFSELREYKKLLDNGIITQVEFDAKKNELLQL